MNVKFPYYYFKNIIPEKVCNDIITAGMSKMAISKKDFGDNSIVAKTIDRKEKGGVKAGDIVAADKTKSELGDEKNYYIRDSKISWISENWLFNLLQKYVQEANYKAGWNYQFDFSEPVQFTVYEKNNFYGWHIDGSGDHFSIYKPMIENSNKSYTRYHYDTIKRQVALDKDGNKIIDNNNIELDKDGKPIGHFSVNPSMWGKVRKLSLTCNLTNPDNYEGGDLIFDLGPHAPKRFHKVEEIRERGSVIVFPSWLYHQVTPVTKGTRYSAVMWSLGYPFQ